MMSLKVNKKPIRVLHVVSQMSPTGGGAEAWLMHLLRHVDRRRFQMDFLVHTGDPQAFDNEVCALGSRILACCRPLLLWKYPSDFLRQLRNHEPYDVCHAHTPYAGLVMCLAKRARIPVRISHSHSCCSGFEADAALPVAAFLAWSNRWIKGNATAGLACCDGAAEALFGKNWRDEDRWRRLHYGLDFSPFDRMGDGPALRAELGIPHDAWVVGHVGRFHDQKNHGFLIRIATELIRRAPNTWLLLVGDGPLRPEVTRLARQAGIADRVILAGVRTDVPQLMNSVMDVLALPSRFEGLPLVTLEAQAAALRIVLSDHITTELEVIPNLITRCSLREPPARWAEQMLRCRMDGIKRRHMGALVQMKASRFRIEACVQEVADFYEETVLGSSHPLARGRNRGL